MPDPKGRPHARPLLEYDFVKSASSSADASAVKSPYPAGPLRDKSGLQAGKGKGPDEGAPPQKMPQQEQQPRKMLQRAQNVSRKNLVPNEDDDMFEDAAEVCL